MSPRKFEKLMDERESRQRQYQFEWAMGLSDEDFARIDQRNHPCFRHMSKEAFCFDYAVRRAQVIRGEERIAIARGIKRLTPAGELINIPNASQIKAVETLLDELGL
jgi:hypothetical protein